MRAFTESFWFLFVLTFGIIFIAVISIVSAALRKAVRRPVRSSDGHIVPESQDLTCETEYGHHHAPTPPGSRYIVHEDPPQGYVVLNGIKRKISDCKYL